MTKKEMKTTRYFHDRQSVVQKKLSNENRVSSFKQDKISFVCCLDFLLVA